MKIFHYSGQDYPPIRAKLTQDVHVTAIPDQDTEASSIM